MPPKDATIRKGEPRDANGHGVAKPTPSVAKPFATALQDTILGRDEIRDIIGN
jgi:hypothetical protein